jgi:hypothetical protein
MKPITAALLFVAVASAEVGLTQITESLHLAQDMSEVLVLMGGDYTEVMSMMEEMPMWRYDFPAEPGYTYTCPSGEDCVDIQGLQTGSMALQLFISWTDTDQVYDYTIYIGTGTGSVNEYRVFADGTVRKSRI